MVARMLYARDWHLTFFTRKTLVTADSPVVLRPMLRYPAGTSVAVGDAAEVQVPLDRRTSLSMTAAGRGDQPNESWQALHGALRAGPAC